MPSSIATCGFLRTGGITTPVRAFRSPPADLIDDSSIQSVARKTARTWPSSSKSPRTATRFESLARNALSPGGNSWVAGGKANRETARARGIAPVIPHKANERDKPALFAKTLYKARSRIEQGIGRLKRFKRVALRCEKTARNFRSIVACAARLCLIKFVHTA
jgi:Transposase DDE domain